MASLVVVRGDVGWSREVVLQCGALRRGTWRRLACLMGRKNGVLFGVSQSVPQALMLRL